MANKVDAKIEIARDVSTSETGVTHPFTEIQDVIDLILPGDTKDTIDVTEYGSSGFRNFTGGMNDRGELVIQSLGYNDGNGLKNWTGIGRSDFNDEDLPDAAPDFSVDHLVHDVRDINGTFEATGYMQAAPGVRIATSASDTPSGDQATGWLTETTNNNTDAHAAIYAKNNRAYINTTLDDGDAPLYLIRPMTKQSGSVPSLRNGFKHQLTYDVTAVTASTGSAEGRIEFSRPGIAYASFNRFAIASNNYDDGRFRRAKIPVTTGSKKVNFIASGHQQLRLLFYRMSDLQIGNFQLKTVYTFEDLFSHNIPILIKITHRKNGDLATGTVENFKGFVSSIEESVAVDDLQKKTITIKLNN